MLFMLTHQMEDIWQCQFPRWSQHCFDIFDLEDRQPDGSRHWDSIKPELMKGFAHEGARDFDDGFRLRQIHDGCTRKRLECSEDKDGNSSYFRAIQRHPNYSATLWWCSNKSGIDVIHAYSIQWGRSTFTTGS